MTTTIATPNLVLNPTTLTLWDFAGRDGRQVAQSLFGSEATQIAPFQSMPITLGHEAGSLLRLCEANYRVALPPPTDLSDVVASLGLDVWIKPMFGQQASCDSRRESDSMLSAVADSMAVVMVSHEWGCARLPDFATTKPLYSLHNLPLEQAAPARVHGLAVVIWHLCWQGVPAIQIQTAVANGEAIATHLHNS